MEDVIANFVDDEFPYPSKEQIQQTISETQKIITRKVQCMHLHIELISI